MVLRRPLPGAGAAVLLAALLALPAAEASAQRPARAPAPVSPAAPEQPDRAWFGFHPVVQAGGVEGPGGEQRIRVVAVIDGSPAARAGLRRGDQVLLMGGRPATAEALRALSTRVKPGDTLRLRVLRQGRAHDLSMVAASRPAGPLFYGPVPSPPIAVDSLRRAVAVLLDSARAQLVTLDAQVTIQAHEARRLAAAAEATRFRMVEVDRMALGRLAGGEARGVIGGLMSGERLLAGAELTEMHEGLEEYFGTSRGLLVLRVAPMTPAERAGLLPGDVISGAGGRSIASIAELRSAYALAAGEGLSLEVVRKGGRRALRLPGR